MNLFFETGARTVEILTLKKFNCSYSEETKHWVVKLPNEKGISTQKMPIELEYSRQDFDAWIKSNNFKDDDLLFKYKYDYFRAYLAEIGRKAIGRKVTPKMFRKSCAMHLVNLDINEQYIKAHMGWSASSKAISHYINQMAIKRPDKLKGSYDVPNNELEVEKKRVAYLEGQLQSRNREMEDKIKHLEAMMMQKFAENYG